MWPVALSCDGCCPSTASAAQFRSQELMHFRTVGVTLNPVTGTCFAQEERDAPVDVQIGPQLYERAPQELRSRLWISLLDNPTLASSVEHSAVRTVSARCCLSHKLPMRHERLELRSSWVQALYRVIDANFSARLSVNSCCQLYMVCKIFQQPDECSHRCAAVAHRQRVGGQPLPEFRALVHSQHDATGRTA